MRISPLFHILNTHGLQEYDACYKEKYFTHCPKCNADNPETAIFCADCGTKLLVHKDIALTKTIEAPKEELTTGAVFAGRYQIIEELGKGGMGRIYKVHDTEIKEKVALKLLRPEIAAFFFKSIQL